MKKVFKYSLRLLIAIVILALGSFYLIFHTEMGARWVVNYLSSYSVKALKINSLQGTLANQLTLNGLSYTDQSIDLKINTINYTIEDINYLNLKVSFASLDIDHVSLKLLANVDEKATISPPFSGIELPLDLDMGRLNIKQLDLTAGDDVQAFNDISMSFNAAKQLIQINNLAVNHQYFNTKGTGSVKLNKAIEFDYTAEWQVKTEGVELAGAGQFSGDLSAIETNQSITIKQNNINGPVTLNSKLDLDAMNLTAEILSQGLTASYSEDQSFEISAFETQVSGWVDDYQVNSQFKATDGLTDWIDFKLAGSGDLDSIDMTQLQAVHADSLVSLPAAISWHDGFKLLGELELNQFNPGIYIDEWQGSVSGQATVLSQLDDSYEIELKTAQIFGSLKEQEFSITGSGLIKPEQYSANELILVLGENRLQINGSLDHNKVNATIQGNLNDLKLFNDQLSGQITTNIDVKGEYVKPTITGVINANNLEFEGQRINSLQLTGSGSWPDNLKVVGQSAGMVFNKNQIEQIDFELAGGLSKHQLKLLIDHDLIETSAVVNGQWDSVQTLWQGQLSEHRLTLKDIQSIWQQQQVAEIKVGKQIVMTPTCWSNTKKTGSACLDFSLTPDEENYQINFELEELEASIFKTLLPSELKIDGYLQGHAFIEIDHDDYTVNTDIKLNNGQLLFAQGMPNEFKAKIINASALATQINKQSTITTKVELSDGTQLDLILELLDVLDDELAIKGTIEGYFANSRYLASLSDEIKEINGSFKVNGSIEGSVSNPIFNITAEQNSGYLILSQTGGVIKNIKLILNKNKDIDFVFNGDSEVGFVKIEGKVIHDNNSWSATAQAVGTDFRLLTLPEIELNISPDLLIKANADGMEISGDVVIPYAKVHIVQLPETAMTSSPDIILHDSDTGTENQRDYNIRYDVNAKIKDVVKIDILGLNSDIKGDLRIKNTDKNEINGYGSLLLNNGQYSIYGQTLDISKGELIFNGPISNPTLDVIASRKSITGDVIAGVQLGGTIEHLQSSLYSEPTLTDLEILSYILSGRGLNEDSGTSSEQLAQAAILLGLKRSSPIFSEIQSKLGIDVLTIKEGVSTKESIVEAGKQFNEKLYIGYNQGLFNRVGFWILRYKINQALRLETTQGDDQAVDLIYQRKKK